MKKVWGQLELLALGSQGEDEGGTSGKERDAGSLLPPPQRKSSCVVVQSWLVA